MSRRLKLLFILSLVLNFFLISFIAGKAYKYNAMKRGDMSLRALVVSSSIPESARADLLMRLDESMNFKQKMKKHRAWKERAYMLLSAEVFDEQAYRMHLADRFLKAKPEKENHIDVVVDIASSLSVEERKKMAEILNRHSKR